MSADSRARRPGFGRLGLALAVAVAASLVVLVPGASANFTLAKCQGSTADGRGASFQDDAHVFVFEPNFRTLPLWCGASAPDVTYDPAGSGAGRRALGERGSQNPQGLRDANIRFAGSDEGPNATQRSQIELGPTVNPDGTGGDLTPTDNGQLRVIPAAQGSIAIIVNFPNGCAVPNTSPQATDPGTAHIRFFAEGTAWENAFAGDPSADRWGELLPTIVGTTKTTLQCQNVLIKRVVRCDSSGTTFEFKKWLAEANPARGWAALGNVVWPNDAGTTVTVRAAPPTCSNPFAGGGPLADKLKGTDGGIGYVVLGDGRDDAFFRSAGADDKYWVKVRNGDPSTTTGVLREPTKDQVVTDGTTKGADCETAQYLNVPGGGDPTLTGDWSLTTADRDSGPYPICALTYLLAFDDNADVYGNTPAEEAEARTVFDYLTSVVHPSGQAKLKTKDYAKLSTSGQNLRGLASQGVTRINWLTP
jgi:ABC-type phosphate transport system substrate-binding protein